MFGDFIDEIFFEEIDLVVLFDAFFDCTGEVLDCSHERDFPFDFLAPTVGFDGFGGVYACGPA
jgi:hypothetical protein